MIWKLSDAKNRLSEVLDRAAKEGPQTISRRGETFVVLPAEKYKVLSGDKPDFKQWLLGGPKIEGLELPSRDAPPMREINFE